jgi:hypothetical protein
MATGTPVNARRAGALPEIIEHGHSGFLIDDLQEAALAVELAGGLDRREVRQRALGRFSVDRMVDDYERLYATLVGSRSAITGEAEPIPVMAQRRGSRNREQDERVLETVSQREAG